MRIDEARSFPSVAATLAHVVGAEWIWLRRWLGESPAAPEWTRGPNLAGRAYSNRLCDLIRHVVNHSTHHRGQAITQLRQFGVTPPNTDLITCLRQGS